MVKIFFVPIVAMLIVLTAVGCATQSTVNYGRALTPAESAPPPVRALREKPDYSDEGKWYDGFGWHWVGPGQRLPR